MKHLRKDSSTPNLREVRSVEGRNRKGGGAASRSRLEVFLKPRGSGVGAGPEAAD